MDVIEKIANSTDPQIQITFDAPSNHDSNMVPILDVQAAINDDNKIVFMFYKKPIQNRLTVMKKSAMPMNKKIRLQTQECFRRIHNTSDDIPEDKKKDILEQFMKDLRLSGYNEQERLNILKGGFKTYENIKLKEKKGLRPFYRSNQFMKEERKQLKKKKK